MAPTRRPDRLIANAHDVAAFRPFDRYGVALPGMTWLPMSQDEASGAGTFLLRMAKGTRSLPHEHTHGEEFLMLEGELVDNDGTVFKPGDYVRFEPGTRHCSTARTDTLIAVFMRGKNRALDEAERKALIAAGARAEP